MNYPKDEYRSLDRKSLSGILIKGLLSLTLASSPNLSAQDDQEEVQEVFELSPFTVEGSGEIGYAATSTLAGTRINTDLKDLANSITVVTKELMEDLQVSDATNMLPYLGNLETAGADGTFGGVGTGGETIDYRGVNRYPDNRNRVRGLAQADSTRNYVPSSIIFDSYNTERVTVNRGPNSTLFGLGSPGGIVDNTTISPRMADRYKVEATFSSFGAYRANIDIDRVLIEDKLGVRIAGLHKRNKWRQNGSFENDDRATIALRYKPTKNTNIRFSQEFGSIDARRPRFSAPTDAFTRWFTEPWADASDPSGKVTHDPSLGLGFRATDVDLVRAPGSWFFSPGVVFENNGSSELVPVGVRQAWEQETPNANSASDGGRLDFRTASITQFRQWSSSSTFAEVTGRDDGGYFGVDSLADRQVFDWVENVITGPNYGQSERFESGIASIDHVWDFPLGNIGFEVTASREEVERGFYDLFDGNRGYQLSIDINTHLNTGEVNPNFGRPFVAGESNRSQTNIDRNLERATVFYELDFKQADGSKWLNLLGRHVGTLFGQDYSISNRGLNSANIVDPDYLLTVGDTANVWSNAGRLHTSVYVGTSYANDSAPYGGQGIITPIQGALDVSGNLMGSYYDETTGSWVTAPVSPINTLTNDENFYNYIRSNSLNRVDTGSHAYVHQAYLFGQEWLVGTYGYRKDKVESYGSYIPEFTEADGTVRTDGRFSNNTVNWRLRQLNEEQTGEPFQQPTESFGVVLHVPEFIPLPEGIDISFHWQDAENFQIGTTRMNILGDIITPPTGQTKEKGFTVGLWNNKFVMKFNKYETVSKGYFNPDGDLYTIDTRVVAMNTPEVLAAAGWQGPPQYYQDLRNWRVVEDPNTPSGYSVETDPTDLPLSDTQSTLSEGVEVDLIFNPSERWRFSANISQQEARRSDIGPGAKAYFDARVAEWTSDGPTGDLLVDTSEQALRLRAIDIIVNSMNILFAREGQLADEIREWRLNLVTNYNFAPDSILGGWNVGGAFRWEDERAAGYPIITQTQDGGEIQVPDLENPWMDDSVERLSLWFGYKTSIMNDTVDWKLQLNLNNILSSGEIVTTSFQPDGTFRSGVWREGRTFQLRSAFEF